MSLATAFSISALVASVYLLQFQERHYPIIAIIASGLEVAIAFGVVSLSIAGVPLKLVLGALLTAVGVVILAKVTGKYQVVAATMVTIVGAIQLLVALRVIGGL